MKDQLTQRLDGLRQEYAAGQKMAADLEARQVEIAQTLLRISGAIQVLEELLGLPAGGEAAPGDPAALAGDEPAVA